LKKTGFPFDKALATCARTPKNQKIRMKKEGTRAAAGAALKFMSRRYISLLCNYATDSRNGSSIF